MKKIIFSLISFLLFFSVSLFSQRGDLPVVRANSEKAYFLEGDSPFVNYWWIDPNVKMDVYEMNKMSSSKMFKFYTDTDSLKVKMSVGGSFDFIVLFNGKDSCYTRVVSPPKITKYKLSQPAVHDTIPFVLTSMNTIKVSAIINGKDSIDLSFDTGNTDISIQQDFIYDKTSLLANKPISYTLEDGVPINEKISLQIGNTVCQNLTVYPTAFAAHETDGSMGWNIFDGRIVEIDYDQSVLVIHSSLEITAIDTTAIALDLEYDNTLLFIEGNMNNQDTIKSRFLLDLGYQKTILLDQQLLGDSSLLLTDNDSLESVRFISESGSLHTALDTTLDQFTLGGNTISHRIPVQVFKGENPMGFPTHIIGNELLKRFNIILDFQDNKLYIKENSLNKSDYVKY